MHDDTVKVPADSEPTTGEVCGTIGFDLYVATIGVPRENVRAPRVPKFTYKELNYV